MTVDELQVLITANTTALQKEIAKTNSTIASLKKSADKSQSGITSAFKKLKTGIVALGIGKIIKESIQTGMDAVESDSLFDTSLGNMADSVRDWTNEVSDALGLNAVSMRKNTGVIYNMTSSMGVAEDNALKMSKGISLLTEDMASFHNLDSTEAFNKLRAGLTGETEPLKALGILVDENTIKQVAYSEGIAENGAELTQQQKVLARYVAILKQTGNAQGDLARTLDSPANQLRILKNQVQQLGLAFSNFLLPMVSAVLPYITAFTKVITTALNSLAKFMGLSNTNASNETANISSNVGGLSTDLDDANKSAKKLKGTLAGFDEMNVLTDNSSDSSSSSGGASGTDIDFDLGEYDAHLDGLSSKADEIAEKIKNVLSKIGEGINFNNLITAFSNLKKAVKPITQTLFNGLRWAYDNLLVPLSQWTINDFVPAFLNAVSGALTILNPVLTTFQTLGTWLWDSFLQPIAEWTGEIIVDTLNGVGTALTTIGEWAGNNQETIDAMVTAFATFFGLWKLTELMAFIQMSGGLIGAITGITSALWGNITAKLTDKAETIALTALYAKDFLASIVAGTSALLKQAGQWALTTASKIADKVATIAHTVATGASTIAQTACTVATTALGVAMNILTSPITLVILAITALIAIIVLCVKNWDTIKTTVTTVATTIKDKVVSAFNTIKTAISNVMNTVKTTISNIWDAIWSTIKGVINSIIGGVETMCNTIIKGLNKIIKPLTEVGNTILEAIGIKNFNFKTIAEVSLPRLAQGGIVDKPTYALIGEAGTEAVMPLEHNTGWIDKLADKLASKIGNSGGSPIQLVVKIGEDTILDKFIQGIKDKDFETNGEVFSL